MAAKEKETRTGAGAPADAEMHPIEELRSQTGTSAPVHAGTCLQMGWSSGKEATKKEYTEAVEKFRNSTAGRSRHA